MNKKRLFSVIAIVVVMVMSITLFASCNGEPPAVEFKLGEEYFGDNFTPMSHEGMERTNLDAHEVLMSAYDYWVNSNGYLRTQYFTFQANAPMKLITNYTMDVYKIDGKKLYRNMVVVQDSKPFKGNRNDITRFYFDGKNAKAGYVNDPAIVPGDPKDIFKCESQPAMADFVGEDENDTVESRMTTYKSHLTTYKWKDEDNWDKRANKKVYKAEDGLLRFTMTIDCSKAKMNNVHMDARDEFLASTGAKEGTLEMAENTTIDFVVEEIKVDDVKTYRFKAWRRTEQYSGEAMGLIAIPAKQTSVEVFSYNAEDYTITDADIA